MTHSGEKSHKCPECDNFFKYDKIAIDSIEQHDKSDDDGNCYDKNDDEDL